MTTQEIIEGNKLIAEFMTGETYNTFYLPEFGQYFNSYGQIEYTETFSPNELKYHSSWDWLMPVVEKIEDVKVGLLKNGDNQEYRNQFYIMRNVSWITPSNWCNNLIDTIVCKTKIEAVWLACVEFIKWYNEQNKK